MSIFLPVRFDVLKSSPASRSVSITEHHPRCCEQHRYQQRQRNRGHKGMIRSFPVSTAHSDGCHCCSAHRKQRRGSNSKGVKGTPILTAPDAAEPTDKTRSGTNPIRAYPTSTIFGRKSSDKREYCSTGIFQSQPPFHNSGLPGIYSLHNCRKSLSRGFPATLL